MNTDRILPVNKEHLLLMQVLCWLGPGIKVLITGIQAIIQVQATHPERVWWLCLIAVAVAICFSLMFDNFIKRYTARILNFQKRKKSLFAFFDLHGYIMIIFFMFGNRIEVHTGYAGGVLRRLLSRSWHRTLDCRCALLG